MVLVCKYEESKCYSMLVSEISVHKKCLRKFVGEVLGYCFPFFRVPRLVLMVRVVLMSWTVPV